MSTWLPALNLQPLPANPSEPATLKNRFKFSQHLSGLFFFPGTENRFNCCCCLYTDNQNQHALIFIAATVLYGRQILANTQRSNCKDGSLIANLQGNLKLGGGVSTVN